MMGMVDPLQQEAQMRDSVMAQGGDLTTSAGLKAKANRGLAISCGEKTKVQRVLARLQKTSDRIVLLPFISSSA